MPSNPDRPSHPDYDDDVQALLESHLFSPAFYHLCSGLGDFDGLIAYGIYKDHKRKALLEKPLKRSDASFHKIHHHLNDSQCETLCKDAQRRLKIYADKVIEDATPRIQRDYAKTHLANNGRGQFWKGVGASLTASFAMLLFFEMSPWFAKQSPTYLAEIIDERLDKIEAAVANQVVPTLPLDHIEPAAGPASSLGDGQLLHDDCLTDSDTLNDPACRGDY